MYPIASSSLEHISAASGYVGYVWDIVNDRLSWFGPWQEIFGSSLINAPQDRQRFQDFIAPEDALQALSTSSAQFDRDFRIQLPGGLTTWVHSHGVTHHENGRAVIQQGLICPRLAPPANHGTAAFACDTLTGRPDRSAMQSSIERALTSPSFEEGGVYIVASIDRMAFINEALGTKAVDILLCDVAARLQSLGPRGMQIGRVGGDMFGLLLTGKTGLAAENTARSILENFRETPFATTIGPLHLSISLGSAPLAATSAAEIMIHAEQALRDARNRGRNLHIGYLKSPARAEERRRVLEIGERVQQALRHDNLHLAFQPVVDSQTGEVLFYEALARLFRDDGQLMTAADFIPVVEQLGLAPVFDRHVLNLAVKELEANEEVRLAVNISGLTASLPDWPDFMRELLAPRPRAAERMIVEITETADLMQIAETKILVDSLRALGSQVALDDFGAGATSIRHLRTWSLAIMKIDKDLLENILTSPEQQHLVRMLISIARGLGLKTVVEGIETAEVAAWLKKERADMLQGYYFGYPSLERPWLTKPGPIFLTGTPIAPKTEGATV
jgi:diguanylate cyclase (GGDEF)-like protein